MRIVSWNSNMAFRKKAKYILPFEPDILVIQESEELNRLDNAGLQAYPHRAWVGENRHKGLLVLAKADYPFTLCPEYQEDYRYILPLRVRGRGDFTLLAVWAQDDRENRRHRYIGQVWLALQEYEHLLGANTVIAGDLNSNAIWDRGAPKIANHSQTVAFLAVKGIYSLYHRLSRELPGEEKVTTFALTKIIEKGYHLDYCFASEAMITANTELKILGFDEWLDKSDHVPLIADFD